MEYHSQFGQDEYLDREVFLGLENGVFLDIGAFDGRTFSNTLFFEQHRRWTGICVEPQPDAFLHLRATRKASCLQCCVSASAGKKTFWSVSGAPAMLSGLEDYFDERHVERIHREIKETSSQIDRLSVMCCTITDILRQHNLTHIHYCSLDTEGGELSILKSIDFQTYRIDVISVENNFGDPRFRKFMQASGYQLLRTDVDEIYRRKDPHELSWKDRHFPMLTRHLRQLKSRFR